MRANTVERRSELLKLEGIGFSENEIVTELSQKYHVDPRTVYRDFETRSKWQLDPDAHKHYLKAFNRLEQIYKRAAAIYLTNSNNANAQLGATRIMADIAIKQIDFSGYKPKFTPDEIQLSWEKEEPIDWDALSKEDREIVSKASEILRNAPRAERGYLHK